MASLALKFTKLCMSQCRVNVSKPVWKNFELSDKFDASNRQVLTVVVRGEFQTCARARPEVKALDFHGRRGFHWHILICLKDDSRVCLPHMAAAHATPYDVDLSYFVNQVYTGGAPASPLNEEPTSQNRVWQERSIQVASSESHYRRRCAVVLETNLESAQEPYVSRDGTIL